MPTATAEPPSTKKSPKRSAKPEPSAAPVVKPEPTITAHNVLVPDRQYGRHALCELLGIQLDTIDSALRSREFSQLFGGGPHVRLRGADVLAWIERAGIPVRIPDNVVQRIEAKRQSNAEPQEATPKQQNTLDQLRQLDREAAEIGAEHTRRQWAGYCGILRRWHAPDPHDAVTLQGIMSDLGIDEDRIRADLQFIKRFEELHERAAGHNDTHAATVESHKKHDELRKECETKLRDSEKAMDAADGTLRVCTQAHSELERLRSHLIEPGPHGLPRLIEDASHV